MVLKLDNDAVRYWQITLLVFYWIVIIVYEIFYPSRGPWSVSHRRRIWRLPGYVFFAKFDWKVSPSQGKCEIALSKLVLIQGSSSKLDLNVQTQGSSWRLNATLNSVLYRAPNTALNPMLNVTQFSTLNAQHIAQFLTYSNFSCSVLMLKA